VIVVLPELLKRVNEDITNLVFGVLLIAIMVLWQGHTKRMWQILKSWTGKGAQDGAPPPGAGG
jgi:hypothetical protein